MARLVEAVRPYEPHVKVLGAVIVTRCLVGTFLPLATDPLVACLGYGWGFTVLGVVFVGRARSRSRRHAEA